MVVIFKPFTKTKIITLKDRRQIIALAFEIRITVRPYYISEMRTSYELALATSSHHSTSDTNEVCVISNLIISYSVPLSVVINLNRSMFRVDATIVAHETNVS